MKEERQDLDANREASKMRNSTLGEIPFFLPSFVRQTAGTRGQPEGQEKHSSSAAAETSFVKPAICQWQAERRHLNKIRGVILRRLCKPLLDSTTGNSRKARVNISKEEAGLLAESDLIARPAI